MKGELKVVYVIGGVEVKQNMTQLQLAELLKNTDIVLISVNTPTVKRNRRKGK